MIVCSVVRFYNRYKKQYIEPSNTERRRMIGIVTDILGCTPEKAEMLLDENDWNIRSAVE